MRKLLSAMAVFVISLLSLSLVSALDTTNVDVDSIRVNGDYVLPTETLAVEEGQTLEIRLGLVSATGVTNVEVDAKISGFEYSDEVSLSDSTPLFNIAVGTTKYVNLQVEVPRELDADQYTLRIRALDRNSSSINWEIPLVIESARNGLDIADVSFQRTTIVAGRSLLATVLLQNHGDRNQNDVKVTVAIPSLGVSAVEYVDVDASDNPTADVDSNDYEDVNEMWLQIPANAEAGDYEVRVTADFNRYDSVTETYTVHVQASELFQPETEDVLVLAAGPEMQNVAAGSKAVYAIALDNAGSRSKAYMVTATTGSWATTAVSESLVVLEAGRSRVVYVDVTAAENAVAGPQTVTVTVSADNEVLETVSLSANVVAAPVVRSNTDLRSGLEIALIVFVVLLIIIGLIFGFSRIRKDSEGEEQTYY